MELGTVETVTEAPAETKNDANETKTENMKLFSRQRS